MFELLDYATILSFLPQIAFAAVLGYASASVLAPYAYGINAGDAQAAAIDATVNAQDHARAIGEGQYLINLSMVYPLETIRVWRTSI